MSVLDKNFIPIITTTFLLIGCTSTIDNAKTQTTFAVKNYTCEGGQSVKITYSTTNKQSLYANVNHKNSIYNLARVKSASGEKYNDGTNTWWSKGDTSFLQIDGVIVLENCTTHISRPNTRMHPSWDKNNDSINDCESDGSCDHTIDYSKPRKPKL